MIYVTDYVTASSPEARRITNIYIYIYIERERDRYTWIDLMYTS